MDGVVKWWRVQFRQWGSGYAVSDEEGFLRDSSVSQPSVDFKACWLVVSLATAGKLLSGSGAGKISVVNSRQAWCFS
jgi:hypothetical protein